MTIWNETDIMTLSTIQKICKNRTLHVFVTEIRNYGFLL